jgi:hypothetical protein
MHSTLWLYPRWIYCYLEIWWFVCRLQSGCLHLRTIWLFVSPCESGVVSVASLLTSWMRLVVTQGLAASRAERRGAPLQSTVFLRRIVSIVEAGCNRYGATGASTGTRLGQRHHHRHLPERPHPPKASSASTRMKTNAWGRR